MNKHDFTNATNMKMAFDFFDENHDGSISVKELQRVFCGLKGEEVLKSIIGETDSDNDGQVSRFFAGWELFRNHKNRAQK